MDLSALSPERDSVVTALQNAAAATGSDFNYLLGTALRESGLKAGAQSATSSPALIVAGAHDFEIRMLLSSVMNWQPKSFFGDDAANPGASAMSSGPGPLGLLSDACES